jgi:hypothetical protein
MMPNYPIPGTRAEAALLHIRQNPGCSKRSVAAASSPNLADNARYIEKLQRHGLIRIETDNRGYHTLWPVAA